MVDRGPRAASARRARRLGHGAELPTCGRIRGRPDRLSRRRPPRPRGHHPPRWGPLHGHHLRGAPSAAGIRQAHAESDGSHRRDRGRLLLRAGGLSPLLLRRVAPQHGAREGRVHDSSPFGGVAIRCRGRALSVEPAPHGSRGDGRGDDPASQQAARSHPHRGRPRVDGLRRVHRRRLHAGAPAPRARHRAVVAGDGRGARHPDQATLGVEGRGDGSVEPRAPARRGRRSARRALPRRAGSRSKRRSGEAARDARQLVVVRARSGGVPRARIRRRATARGGGRGGVTPLLRAGAPLPRHARSQ